MKKLWILLKTRYKNTYNIDKLKNINKIKILAYAVLIIYAIFSLLTTFYGFANNAITFLSDYQMISYAITLFFVGATFSTFMFTVYNAKSAMFNANDNDMLLSLPIKPSTILASRLIYIMIWNLITCLFVMGPVFIVYAIKVNVSMAYYPYALIVFLLLPVIPTIIASVIGYIIAYFTAKSNMKNWFEIIMSFVLIFVIYYAIGNISNILNYLVTNIDNFDKILKYGFYPIYLVSQIFNNYDIMSLMLFIIINLLLFVGFTFILSINFKKIIAKLQENRSRSNYVMRNLRIKNVSASLYRKELKRFLSSPIYVFNATTGVMMFIIAAIATVFYDKKVIIDAMGFTDASLSPLMLLTPVIVFVVFLSNSTSASISLEGKNFWIVKSLPVEPIKILWSKIYLNMSYILVFVFAGLVIIFLTLKLSVIELIVLLFLAFLSSLVATQYGLLINLKFPNMNAVNDVVIVKRSASVMIMVFSSMILIFGVVQLYSSLSSLVSFNVFLWIVMVLLFVIALIENYILKTWGVKRFKEIN